MLSSYKSPSEGLPTQGSSFSTAAATVFPGASLIPNYAVVPGSAMPFVPNTSSAASLLPRQSVLASSALGALQPQYLPQPLWNLVY